jgi:hypothetical protein
MTEWTPGAQPGFCNRSRCLQPPCSSHPLSRQKWVTPRISPHIPAHLGRTAAAGAAPEIPVNRQFMRDVLAPDPIGSHPGGRRFESRLTPLRSACTSALFSIGLGIAPARRRLSQIALFAALEQIGEGLPAICARTSRVWRDSSNMWVDVEDGCHPLVVLTRISSSSVRRVTSSFWKT